MITLESGLIILVGIIAIVFSARKNAKHRAIIKERANRDYEQENELSQDELETRLSESELMYEHLEETHWLSVGLLVGIATYFYWHIWYVSVAIGIGLIIIGSKYLSLHPFTTGVPDR